MVRAKAGSSDVNTADPVAHTVIVGCPDALVLGAAGLHRLVFAEHSSEFGARKSC